MVVRFPIMQDNVNIPFPDNGLPQPRISCDREQEPDIVTLNMDIYFTQSMGDFVRLSANMVLGKLNTAPPLKKALNRIGQFIRSCRPVFTIDELTGVPKETIDMHHKKRRVH